MTVFVYLSAAILLGSITESALAFLAKCVMKYRISRGHVVESEMIDDFVVFLEDRYSKLNDDCQAT